MSIQNLVNGRVNINPLNLKIDLLRFETSKLANGQLSWQFVKRGAIGAEDESYITLVDPLTDDCWSSYNRGRLRIEMLVRTENDGTPANWEFRFLVGVEGTPIVTGYQNTYVGAGTTEALLIGKEGVVAPGAVQYALWIWDIDYNPSADEANQANTYAIWSAYGAMWDGAAAVIDTATSGSYINIGNFQDITGIQIATTDQGALQYLEYSIFALGP